MDAVVFEFFGGLSWVVPPAYTASLDAVVSLIERELPHGYDLWAREGSSVAMIYWSEDDGCKATAKTPALALLLAFLTAIKDRDE